MLQRDGVSQAFLLLRSLHVPGEARSGGNPRGPVACPPTCGAVLKIYCFVTPVTVLARQFA